MKIFIYQFLFILFSVRSCAQVSTPVNINEAINYFEDNWSQKEKYDFKNKSEETSVSELHFTTGLWIRNNWIRGKDNDLVKYFDSIGINNPDDISSIILTSLHRKLNDREIKLNDQVKYYHDYWKSITERNNKSKEKAVEIYSDREIGDTVVILYPIDISDNEKNAVIYEDNKDWIFDSKKDLKLTGIITKKFFINNDRNVFFELKITSLNQNNVAVLGQKIEIGKKYDFHLDKLIFE